MVRISNRGNRREKLSLFVFAVGVLVGGRAFQASLDARLKDSRSVAAGGPLKAARSVEAAPPRHTFNADIAPIVLARCAPCHRPGAIGPFSLITYDDVRRRAAQIATVTA